MGFLHQDEITHCTALFDDTYTQCVLFDPKDVKVGTYCPENFDLYEVLISKACLEFC